MAAYVVLVRDEKKWEVISKLLCEVGEGGILVPPDTARKLDEDFPDWENKIDRLMDYDYGGGDYDVVIDIALNGNFADIAVRKRLGELPAE